MIDQVDGLGGNKLKDKIISILTVTYPQTAKEIHSLLKNQYQTSVSYQAVHKSLKELVTNKILVEKDRAYKIDINWVDRIREFCTDTKGNYLANENAGKTIKAISFDLDGCLSDNAFDELVWRKKIPEIYAKERGVPFDRAFLEVTTEYKRLWGKVAGWRDVEFWFRHFGFNTTWQSSIKEIEGSINHYGDVIPVLKVLSKHFLLVIISHADRKFLDLKLSINDLGKYFTHTYSTTSDFGEYKKSGFIFLSVCKKLGVEPDQIVHIGDSKEYDYEIPLSVGIRSYVIDRIGTEKERFIVRDLYEFKDKVLK